MPDRHWGKSLAGDLERIFGYRSRPITLGRYGSTAPPGRGPCHLITARYVALTTACNSELGAGIASTGADAKQPQPPSR